MGSLVELKTIVKSLIISCPNFVTIEKLLNDFYDMEGYEFPFKKFGFPNPEQFLRKLMSDVVIVYGYGINAKLAIIFNERTEHIARLVNEQKCSPRKRSFTNSKLNQYSGSVKKFNDSHSKYATRRRPPRFRGCSRNPVAFKNIGCENENERNVSKSYTGRNNNWSGKSETFPSAKSIAQIPTKKPAHLEQPAKVNLNKVRNCNGHNTESQQNSLNYSNALNFMQKYKLPPLKADIKSKGLQNKDDNPPVSEKMQNQLECTLKRTDICEESREDVSAVNEEVNSSSNKNFSRSIHKVSFKEKDEVCLSNRNVNNTVPIDSVQAEKRSNLNSPNDTNNVCLQPADFEKANSKVTLCVDKEGQKHQVSLNASTASSLSDIFARVVSLRAEELEKAVPEFACDSTIYMIDFPEDSVKYGKKIASCKPPDHVKVGSILSIFLTEIHNPYRFWFHYYEDDDRLAELMHNLSRFYEPIQNDEEYEFEPELIQPGQVCAALFENEWHRGECVSNIIAGKVKVFFMDYGTVCEIPLNHVKYLYMDFAELPAFAHRGSLSELSPIGLHWSTKASVKLLSLTEDKLLYGKVFEIDHQNRVLYLNLVMNHHGKIVQINRKLINLNLALKSHEWARSKQMKTARIRNKREDYPPFAMLEEGSYPTLTEIIHLESLSINYEAITDKLIHSTNILNFEENVPEKIRSLNYFLLSNNPFKDDIIKELEKAES